MSDPVKTFQPMPPLSADQYVALRQDIAQRGVLMPVIVDQHGRVLDGHNRKQIADELGISYPTETVDVADDHDAMSRAVILNCARRHLTQEQKRTLIRSELGRCWDEADRSIARRVGCSPTTVGALRSEMRHSARRSTEVIREQLRAVARDSAAIARSLHDGTGVQSGQGIPLQDIGDYLEHQTVAPLVERFGNDPELLEGLLMVVGPTFDCIRSFVCPPECETCTEEHRAWREANPAKVVRYTEPDFWSQVDVAMAEQGAGGLA